MLVPPKRQKRSVGLAPAVQDSRGKMCKPPTRQADNQHGLDRSRGTIEPIRGAISMDNIGVRSCAALGWALHSCCEQGITKLQLDTSKCEKRLG
jgi:hypothetical protein